MTAREMQIAFQQHLETHLGYVIIPVQSDDIQHFLNEAQEEIYDELVLQFEKTQVITDNLKPFVTKETVLTRLYAAPTYAGLTYYIDYGQYPANYNYALNVRAEVQVANSGNYNFQVDGDPKRVANGGYSDYTTKLAKCRFAKHDNILLLLEDPFNKPTATNPLYTISSRGIDVHTDATFICNNIILDYLTDPVEIDFATPTPSSFPDHMHRDIVERAVGKYLQFSPKTQ